MIIISNYSHYHTPYQVQGIFEAIPDIDLIYYNAVNPWRLNKICRDVPKKCRVDFFNRFVFDKIIDKYAHRSQTDDHLYEDDYERYICKKIAKVRKNIEIFHSFNCSALETMKILSKDVIKIVECGVHPQTYYNICKEEYENQGVNKKPLSYRFIDKSVEEFEMADYVLTISDICVQSFVENGINQRKIIKLPIAANLSRIRKTKPRKDTFTVLYVGRVTVLKGVQYLVEACKRLRSAGLELICNIVGPVTDQAMEKLEKEYSQSRYIHFLGSKNVVELSDFYSEASVMVMPSLIDSFCMSVYESLSVGTPVIVSNYVGAEVDDGRDGYIFTVRDVDQLAECISKFYYNRSMIEEFGSRGKKRILLRNWRSYGVELALLYDSLRAGR